MKIWREPTKEPTYRLVMSPKALLWSIGFGGLAGAFLGITWAGGTDNMAPWQWGLCAGLVTGIIALMFIGYLWVFRELSKRLEPLQKD